MEYGQRSSGIFVRQNLIPQSDLQAEKVYPEGQMILPNVHQSLAYLVGQGPLGPRMLQTDSSGDLSVFSNGGFETLPQATRLVLVPSRTDTSTYTSADISLPGFTIAIFTFRATAVSGTTPSMVPGVQTKDSQGNYSVTHGGSSGTALTTAGVSAIVISAAAASSAVMLGPIFRILGTITGTTPSFTWYTEVIYK